VPFTHYRPVSPLDGIHLKDDFYSNDPVTDALIGELHWEFALIGNVSTVAYLTAVPYGAFKDTTAATANGDGMYYRLFTDGLVLGGQGGGFSTRVRLADQIASNNFRIGVDDSVTATAPGSGIWVNCDGGVLSLECYSNDHGDAPTAPAAGVSTLTDGTTMIVNTWYTIRVEWTGENGQGGPRYVEMWVDDEPAAASFCALDDDEEVECKIVHWQDSGGALAVELDVDFYEFWAWR